MSTSILYHVLGLGGKDIVMFCIVMFTPVLREVVPFSGPRPAEISELL